ncbi:type VI secretion system baseplate subunit TssK [Azospirillum rugosum]|uniref:Type VI secretion system protein ImpJ n=1 Tax=Azospirillum rugosum TaxID=416170 RepID=A0ABS4SKX6_9PROT|nr:type VI secretion system baseplate subunit TssK [Azospirillum rugosum]MBP2293221.1 type VI secretion system protein ImpJ [Azospirillum rugosum]
MVWDNKVVWSEGMFLRAQHFQQFDRYVETLVDARTKALCAYGWGVTELDIDRDLLGTGKLALRGARGVLPDGTPFHLPEQAPLPTPIEPAESVRNCTVYLALPLRSPGRADVALPPHEQAVTRYAATPFEATDAVAGSNAIAQLQVGQLRLRLMLGSEDRSGYACVGVARIVEVLAGRGIVLDRHYIPPSLVCAAAPQLIGFLAEMHGLITQRAEVLANRLGQAGAGGAAEVADFLMLQLCNRYGPLLAHHDAQARLHPESLYSLFVQMAGELATFNDRSRRPPKFEPYRHDDLQMSFQPVVAELRRLLSAVLEQTAIPIPLQDRRYGIRVAAIPDRSLIDAASFVLAVRADMPSEQLRRNFPLQVKIGPVELIRDLVMSALPGIGTDPLPVAPRQIPFNAGSVYFALDRGGAMWKQLGTSGGLAIHLSGDFPQIVMELWAIRG